MLRLNPSKRFLHFLFWAIVTCTLLRIQKLMYEDTSALSLPNSFDHEDPSPPSSVSPVPQVPFHPFVEGYPKILVILSYQRSGSTFFGNLFNRNPHAFYMFEPIDGFYSHFYGTSMAWNVPSDITSYQNGSERLLPMTEIRGVSKFMSSILSCNLEELPAEALLHPYIYYYRTDLDMTTGDYIKCIDKYENLMKQCGSRSPSAHCGFRFGLVSEARLQECHRALHDEEFRNKHKLNAMFQKYSMCSGGLKKIVDKKCLPILKTKCEKKSLRVIKTVRATMDSMEYLLQKFPNFRIIHLMRDPRAVVLSRKLFDSSSRALYSEVNSSDMMVREAKVLCRTLTRDVRLRLDLEKKYPGKIYPVIYDEMVRNLQQSIVKTYRFLDYPNVINMSWWKSLVGPGKSSDSIKRADNWQRVLNFEQNKAIVDQCRDLLDLVGTPFWSP